MTEIGLFAADLDGTLAESKQPISNEMAGLLGELLQETSVAIISGGAWHKFQSNVLPVLDMEAFDPARLHLLPACGTTYFAFDQSEGLWMPQYSEGIEQEDRERISLTLLKGAAELGILEENPWGELIEDRVSQITFSGLGQQAPPEEKEQWDRNRAKRESLQAWASPHLLDFQIRVGGPTSVDVTKPGIDKGYGMNRLLKILGIPREGVVFVGDNLQEGGNDRPVKDLGIKSFEVDSPLQTRDIIEGLLAERSLQ